MNMKAKKKENAGSFPPDFPSPEEIVSQDYKIDINTLVSATNCVLKGHKTETGMIKKWMGEDDTLVFNSRDTSDFISVFSWNLAEYFQKIIFTEPYAKLLYLAWSRIAANMENPDVMLILLEYAIIHSYPSTDIQGWAEDAAEQYFSKTTTYSSRAHKDEYLVEQIKKIIYLVSSNHPHLGLRFCLMLITSRLNVTGLDKLEAHSDSLIKKIGGVRILTPSLPSTSREVDRTVEQYKELTNTPTPLIKTGDLGQLKLILNNEFPWFSSLTKQFYQHLLVRQLGDSVFYLPPTLLIGPPGIGKTSYINRLSVLAGVPFKSISLAGKNDNKDFTGTARGWSTGEPSSVINFINQKKIANPIFLLDEIDKAGGSDHNGRVHDTLLNLFEPSSACSIYDEYLTAHADLSHITWLCSANDVSQMPTTLLSRLDVITVQKPKPEHYPKIVHKSIASFCSRNGINSSHIPKIEESDWKWFSKYYSSPRKTRRAVEKWLGYKLLTPTNGLN
ncbi:MAG: hypothetical protein AXW17_10195 [Colwellia sp. Phe_37]|nr:MAG: hypothetical protein AXW17_10195 [Colwellia sp. Phe_37]